RIRLAAHGSPPRPNGGDGKLRSVMRDPDRHIPAIAPNLIEAVRDRLPARQAGKVVYVDRPRLTLPGAADVAEVANQLFFLGIHTDDRPLAPQKRSADLGNVAQLLLTSRRLSPRQPFAVDAQRVPRLAQQAADRWGAKL